MCILYSDRLETIPVSLDKYRGISIALQLEPLFIDDIGRCQRFYRYFGRRSYSISRGNNRNTIEMLLRVLRSCIYLDSILDHSFLVTQLYLRVFIIILTQQSVLVILSSSAFAVRDRDSYYGKT